MRNTKRVSVLSQNIVSSNRATWIPLYYSIENNAVYTKDGAGRFKVTDLINPNTQEDIEKAVSRYMSL